ncbi:MAG: hypothetical protein IT373_07180, partial [Polyangiaceae bacterium]|nr:hypothetical protein [Polyangiaceae bacterium]
MKRSAPFLRLGAVTWAAYALCGIVFEILRARAFAAYRAGPSGPDAQGLHERLELYATLDWACHLALGVVLAASLGLFAASLGRARASVLAWVGCGLQALALAASVTSFVALRTGALGAPEETGSLVLVELLWLGRAALGVAALALFLAATCVAVERPATAGWAMLGTYLCLAVGGLGLFAYRLFGAVSGSAALDWAGRIVDYGADGLVVGTLFWGGARLVRQPAPGVPAAATEQHTNFV